jgi:hypothetical protein
MKSVHRYPTKEDYGQGNTKEIKEVTQKERGKKSMKATKMVRGLKKQFVITGNTCKS